MNIEVHSMHLVHSMFIRNISFLLPFMAKFLQLLMASVRSLQVPRGTWVETADEMCMRQKPALWTYLPLFFPPLSLLPTLLYFFLPKAPTQLIRVVSCMKPKGHTPPWTWRVCINQTYGLRRGSKSGCTDGAGNNGNQNAFLLLLLLLSCFSRVRLCATP